MTDNPAATPTTPDDDLEETGRKLFAGAADFIWASSAIDNLPPPGALEIAFAGRSNVGKSSLVNGLTGRKTLARTSHTPGRTQQLNFFDIGSGRLRIVDMPGYGFAAVGKEKVGAWTKLIADYLRGRQTIGRVFVLIDARHGLKPNDTDVLDGLDTSAVSYQIVLTKMDELKPGEIERRIDETGAAIRRRPAAFPEILPTSGKTGAGVPAMRTAIARLMAERSR